MDSLCNRLDNMPFDNFRKEELIKLMVDNLLHGFNIRRTFKVACQVGNFFQEDNLNFKDC